MKKYSLFFGLTALIAIAGSAFALRLEFDDGMKSAGANVEAIPSADENERPSETASYPGCGSSRCGSSPAGSSCCGSGASPTQAQIEQIRTTIYDYYAKALADPSIEVEVQDLGCHQEAAVIKKGEVIKRLSINGREISEIG